MWTFFSSLFGVVSSALDFFSRKRLADAVEGKVIAEAELEAEKVAHERTKDNHKIELDVIETKVNEIQKVSQRIEG